MAVRRDRIRTAIIGTGGIARQHVRRLIDSGELGRPLVAVCNTLWYRDNAYYAVPWRGTWQSELGGVSMGHGIHIMDLLLYLCGDWSEDPWPYPPHAGAQHEVEDVSLAMLRFDDGALRRSPTVVSRHARKVTCAWTSRA